MSSSQIYRWIPPWGEPPGYIVFYFKYQSDEDRILNWIDPNFSHSFFLNEIYRNRFK